MDNGTTSIAREQNSFNQLCKYAPQTAEEYDLLLASLAKLRTAISAKTRALMLRKHDASLANRLFSNISKHINYIHFKKEKFLLELSIEEGNEYFENGHWQSAINRYIDALGYTAKRDSQLRAALEGKIHLARENLEKEDDKKYAKIIKEYIADLPILLEKRDYKQLSLTVNGAYYAYSHIRQNNKLESEIQFDKAKAKLNYYQQICYDYECSFKNISTYIDRVLYTAEKLTARNLSIASSSKRLLTSTLAKIFTDNWPNMWDKITNRELTLSIANVICCKLEKRSRLFGLLSSLHYTGGRFELKLMVEKALKKHAKAAKVARRKKLTTLYNMHKQSNIECAVIPGSEAPALINGAVDKPVANAPRPR